MFRRESVRGRAAQVEPISDVELGFAALLLMVVLTLATIVVPALG